MPLSLTVFSLNGGDVQGFHGGAVVRTGCAEHGDQHMEGPPSGGNITVSSPAAAGAAGAAASGLGVHAAFSAEPRLPAGRELPTGGRLRWCSRRGSLLAGGWGPQDCSEH